MPDASQREQILDALKARLEAIEVGNGFATDAGLSVHLGEAPAFGEDDPRQAIVIVVNDDEVSMNGKSILVEIPLVIQAVVAADVNYGLAYRDAEAVLADIKRAVELEDRTMGGLVRWTGLVRGSTRTLQREPGSRFVGVGVEYRAGVKEKWGNP